MLNAAASLDLASDVEKHHEAVQGVRKVELVQAVAGANDGALRRRLRCGDAQRHEADALDDENGGPKFGRCVGCSHVSRQFLAPQRRHIECILVQH